MAESPGPTRGPGLTALCIVMIILSILAVTLRVWSRLLSKNQRFWWDDWFAIASLPFLLGILSVTLAWVSIGLGHHASQVSHENIVRGFKYRYAIGNLYHFGITLPKYSAICFYIRVFTWRSSSLFRINTLVVTGLVTAWLLFAVPSTIFQCTPIRKGWLPLTPGRCLDANQWFLGSTISSVVIDVYIMLLPIPVLWNLHTGHARKIVLTSFFFCAYCVIACSLGRLIAIVQDSATFATDMTYNTIPYTKWSIAEAAISTICICLPNLTHLIQRVRHHGPAALFSVREYTLPKTVGSKGQGEFRRIGENDDDVVAVVRDGDDGWAESQGSNLYGVVAPCGDGGGGFELREVHVMQAGHVRGVDER
ncbi:hypothetical protein BDR22DRAFT_922698 [Usnea florida]